MCPPLCHTSAHTPHLTACCRRPARRHHARLHAIVSNQHAHSLLDCVQPYTIIVPKQAAATPGLTPLHPDPHTQTQFDYVGAGGLGGATTPGFTPSRVLLTNTERRMNLLTPEAPHLVHHADIETGKIVSTWSFQKVGH